MKFLDHLVEHFDATLAMRFVIVLIVLAMLWKAMFAEANEFDEGLKNALILLVGTAVGYFFNTSKGSSDSGAVIREIAASGTKTSTTVNMP